MAGQFPRKIFGRLGYDETSPGLPAIEFIDELTLPEGLDTFMRMEHNDPIIGGLILQIKLILANIQMNFSGPNKDFVSSQMGFLPNLVDEMASALVYGFYLGEEIWTSEGSNIVLKDIEPRFQPSIRSISKKVQQVTSSGAYEIPLSKCLHFTFFSEARSPFGRSLLRHIYKPYYYKIACEAAEATGIDRDLSGLPVMEAPEGFDFSAADSASPTYDASVAETLNWAIDVVANIRRDSQQGVVIPNGWQLSLMRGSGTASINPTEVIQRYNSEMSAGLLEMFLSASQSGKSDRSVESQISNFVEAANGYANKISRAINDGVVRKICDYNGLADRPTLTFGTITSQDLAKLASFVARLVKSGVITPTIPLERELLALAKLPYSDDKTLQKEVL